MSLSQWTWHAQQPSGTAPAPRANFASMVVHTTGGKRLIIAGGYNGQDALGDAFTLHLDQLRWEALKLKGEENAFEKRMMFAYAAAEDGEHMYVHGGTDPSNVAALRGDLVAMNVRKGTVSTISTAGDKPPSLARHAIACMRGALWLFGGWDGKSFHNDLYTLPVSHKGDKPWAKVSPTGFMPYPRAYCCLLSWPPNLLLFGGSDADFDFGDVYAFSAETLYWQRFHNASHTTNTARSQAGCTLVPPSQNPGITLAVHGGFGGPPSRPDEGTRRTDMRLLPVRSDAPALGLQADERWSHAHALGSPPLARMGHALHAVNSSCLVLFGGTADMGGSREHTNEIYFAVRVEETLGDDVAAEGSGAGAEAEEVIVRTVRVADGTKPRNSMARAKRRGKKKTTKRGTGTGKEEL